MAGWKELKTFNNRDDLFLITFLSWSWELSQVCWMPNEGNSGKFRWNQWGQKLVTKKPKVLWVEPIELCEGERGEISETDVY